MTRLDRLTERLDLKEFQLRALLEVTKAINGNVGRRDLLQLYGDILTHELGITRMLLFEHGEQWKCVRSVGADKAAEAIDAGALMGRFRDIQFIGAGLEGLVHGFDIAVPVFHEDRPLALLLIGDLDDGEQRMSPSVKHLNFIQTLTNLIVVALENKRLAQQALQQERDKRELELAAEMQSLLIPGVLPNDGRLQAAAWYLPHRQVGGDYYDLVRFGDHEAVVCVADVSGKGMAAALLMSNFQATLRALLQYTEEPLDELVHDLNDKVMSTARSERFVTCFIARIDLRTGRMRYVNAGHNPPLLHTDGRITELTSGCIALGMLPKLPFLQVGEAEVRPGSVLLCYTDGLVEQEDAHGNAFDTAPLLRVVKQFHAAGPQAINDTLIATFEAHRAGLPYLDDIALLTCRFA
jgi:sigma-B regulation protein RsbU (phosphoserine phosphatase)